MLWQASPESLVAANACWLGLGIDGFGFKDLDILMFRHPNFMTAIQELI